MAASTGRLLSPGQRRAMQAFRAMAKAAPLQPVFF